MRVAVLVARFPSLSQTFILNQITGLIDRGVAVDIYAHAPSGEPKAHPDVDAYRLPDRTHYGFGIGRGRLARGLWRLGALGASGPRAMLTRLLGLRQRRYDVIHAHFGPLGHQGLALREAGLLDGRLVTSFHGYDITRHVQEFGEHCYERLFDRGDLFLPISERWRSRLIELGCESGKIAVHRMGIDCRRFVFTPRPRPASGPVRLVTIARLVEKKGVEYGIRAVARLLRAGHRLEYDIIGDGPLKEELARLIQELGVGEAVRLLGWKQQDEIAPILAAADVLLAPSVTGRDGDQEGIPVALMEAMASGLLVVSTLHSGIPELISDRVTGYLVPERDVPALAEALEHLIGHRESWPELCRAARVFVERNHDLERLNDRLVEVYRSVTAAERAA